MTESTCWESRAGRSREEQKINRSINQESARREHLQVNWELKINVGWIQMSAAKTSYGLLLRMQKGDQDSKELSASTGVHNATPLGIPMGQKHDHSETSTAICGRTKPGPP